MSSYACSHCDARFSSSKALNYCVACKSAVCEGCTASTVANRARLVVCRRCPAQEGPPFACARCATSIAATQLEWLCEMCGNTLCSKCVAASFEHGKMKCARCADYPVRWRVSRAPVPCVLSADVVAAVQRARAGVPCASPPSPLSPQPAAAATALPQTMTLSPTQLPAAAAATVTTTMMTKTTTAVAASALPPATTTAVAATTTTLPFASSSLAPPAAGATATAKATTTAAAAATSATDAAYAAIAAAAAAAATSKYRVLYDKQKLGEGAQGVVYKCRTSDNQEVVSKEMLFDDVDAAVFAAQLRQAERMRKLNHPHLIRYLDVVARWQPPQICVIMPYYNEGDLKQFIVRQRKPVPELRLCSIVLQIAQALHYLHSQDPPLVHRDIKPENILLLNNEEQVLLMDLDLCGSADMMASITRRRRVSPTYEYRAPELEGTAGSPKSDVFSLGVVLYVLATLPEFPCVRTSNNEEMVLSAGVWQHDSLERAVRRAVYNVRTYTYSEPLVTLLVRMLAHDPAERPSSGAVAETLVTIMEHQLSECVE